MIKPKRPERIAVVDMGWEQLVSDVIVPKVAKYYHEYFCVRPFGPYSAGLHGLWPTENELKHILETRSME